MAVRSIGAYKFPSRSRQELYGEDQLVHVLWRNNAMMAAAACFRAPKSIPFATFVHEMVEPWAASDPDFVAGSIGHWQLDGKAIEPKDDEGLIDIGVRHKYVLSFSTSRD